MVYRWSSSRSPGDTVATVAMNPASGSRKIRLDSIGRIRQCSFRTCIFEKDSNGHTTGSFGVRWWGREGASRLNQRVVAGRLTYLYHTDCKRQLHTPTSHRVDNPAPSSQVPQTPNPRLCFHAFEPMFVCVRYAQGGGGRGGAAGAVTIVTDKGTFQVP